MSELGERNVRVFDELFPKVIHAGTPAAIWIAIPLKFPPH